MSVVILKPVRGGFLELTYQKQTISGKGLRNIFQWALTHQQFQESWPRCSTLMLKISRRSTIVFSSNKRKIMRKIKNVAENVPKTGIFILVKFKNVNSIFFFLFSFTLFFIFSTIPPKNILIFKKIQFYQIVLKLWQMAPIQFKIYIKIRLI